MTATTSFEYLFSPLMFAGLGVKNRIVMAPMGTGLPSEEGVCNARTIAYYRRRAEGGVGMITIEASLVSPDAYGVGPELRLHGEEFLPGLRHLVEALRPFGIPLGIQLWHPGRQTLLGTPVAPSGVPLSPRTPVPRALTVDEIREYVRWYARSAEVAREAGFDYVEVHGAHCYLPCEFLSPLSNLRDDGYGGCLENRARFSLEIVSAIRERCGEDYPVFFRLSGEEGVEGGFAVEEAVAISRLLERAGVACISVSAGSWHALHRTIAPMFVPRGYLLHLARAVKEAVAIPVMAVGRLDDPELAERALAEGDADLIALGRALIADPDWPVKVREGRLRDIRPCIACNACVDLVARGQEARCAVNSEVGHELEWRVEPAETVRRVLVVGGGPAGMEAARIARLRGHVVSIWEREPRLGGKLDVASRAPSKRAVLAFRDYQERQLKELGVEIHTGVEVTAEIVAREKPDIVVVAVGADPLIPPIPGTGGPNVVDAEDVLHGRVPVQGGERFAVVGGSATGCETAEYLAEAGAEVVILEMLPSIGHGIEQITRRCLLAKLRELGVRILTGAKVTAMEPGCIRYVYTESGAEDAVAVDRIALAIGWSPRGERFTKLLAGCRILLVGDAARPADFVRALQTGAAAGFEA